MKNLGQLMKQAQEMQAKMAEMQERLAEMEVSGSAGADMVKVTLNGKGELRGVSIDPFTAHLPRTGTAADGRVAACCPAAARSAPPRSSWLRQGPRGEP